jgi:NitT/TauT family transport system ATP-binding protein
MNEALQQRDDGAHAKIEAKGISMVFSGNGSVSPSSVLNGVSFSLRCGSFTSLLGPSGCGKTTLLRILAGLLPPTHGEVLVDGRSVASPSPDRTVIFQDYGLFEWKTVRENVEFGLKAKGMPRGERHKIAQRYIDLVHLRGAERKYPRIVGRYETACGDRPCVRRGTRLRSDG